MDQLEKVMREIYSGIDIHELIHEWLKFIHYHKYERYPLFSWLYPFFPQFHTSEIFTLGNKKVYRRKNF